MRTRRSSRALLAPAALALLLGACRRGPEGPSPETVRTELEATAEAAWNRVVDRLDLRSEAIEDTLRPIPYLTASEESTLRRHLNAEHLARARQLGIGPPADSAERAALVEAGRLVSLPDSTERFVVRDLDRSLALVTPDTRALLDELGRRFQARLDTSGLPAYRIEVTSALRTAAGQAMLREENPNAAEGVSAHQFGTTVDIAYSGFTAPLRPIVDVEAPEAPWLEPHLARMAGVVAERMAGRKSRELMAILGRVLEEMQGEGKVLVTLERRQPVYHLTVARRLAGP